MGPVRRSRASHEGGSLASGARFKQEWPLPNRAEIQMSEEDKKRALATQLPQQLEALHHHRASGVLTDEEFVAAKLALLSMATGTPAERLAKRPEPPKSAPVSPRHRPSPTLALTAPPAAGEAEASSRKPLPAWMGSSALHTTSLMRQQQSLYDEVQGRSEELYGRDWWQEENEWFLVPAGRNGQVVVAGRPRHLALYDRSVGQADRRMVEPVAQSAA